MITTTTKARPKRAAKKIAYQRQDGTNVAAQGEGLYQRKDAIWVAPLPFTDPMTGGKALKTFTSKDPNEAIRKREIFRQAQAQGLEVGAEKQTVGDFLAWWLEYQVKPNTRPRTHDSYAQVVACYITPALGARVLRDLQPEHVELMMASLRKRISKRGKPLSARTITYARAVLRKALNHALRRGRVARNVVTLTDPPKATRPRLPVPTPEQTQALLDAVRGHRHETLYSVSVMLGLRIGEVLGLRREDVNIAEGTITISYALQRRKGFLGLVEPKTEQSRRTLFLPPPLRAALEAHFARQMEEQRASERWRGNGLGLVFVSTVGTPLEPRNVTRHFKSVLVAAGLPDFRIHDLRHAYATLLARNDVHPRKAMHALGHSHIHQTMEVYTHVEQEGLREIAALVGRQYAGAADGAQATRGVGS